MLMSVLIPMLCFHYTRFSILIAVTLMCVHEFSNSILSYIKDSKINDHGKGSDEDTICIFSTFRYILYIFAFLVPLSAAYSLSNFYSTFFCSILTCIVVTLYSVGVSTKTQTSALSLQQVVYTLFGICWIIFPLSHAILLLLSKYSLTLVLYPIFVVGVGENGGLFLGYSLGTTVPFPSLSPNKTKEGYYAQIGTSVIASVLFSLCASTFGGIFSLPISHSIILGTLLGIFGIIGDLFESFFKRCLELKDVSNMLPGWGGLLDRVDGLLIAFPLTYYYFTNLIPEIFM